jgi:mevalonate kinase
MYLAALYSDTASDMTSKPHPQPVFFPAKLLLFGEYTVLLESQALAVPFPKFGGHWSAGNSMDQRLVTFADYIRADSQLCELIDTTTFRKEVQEGWQFQSDIPLGYGLGSSGALCAAVFTKYSRQVETSIPALKSIFARLESHFHGTSSGVDPLIAYLQKPLFKDQNGWQVLPDFEVPKYKELQFFLLDTKYAREAGTFIDWFTKQCKTAAYRQQLETKVLPLIEILIELLKEASMTSTLSFWHELSWLQWQFFQPMIPEFLHSTYLNSLESDWYKLKLCGAGGGGFFLGVTTDIERLKTTVDFPILAI